jgi:tetratricopeptide (TPR) repeat protein
VSNVKAVSPHRIWLGRAREISELEAALDALDRGRGSLFLVTGEPGIGKTRLADELGRVAAGRGASVHWGRAWEAGGAPSYWPFIQLLRAISPEGAALLASPAQSATERFQRFEAVDGFLRAAGPRVIVLDDLHAADPSSLQLLQFLVRDLRARQLMVVGTYRDAEARLQPEVRSLLAQISREACVMPLARLARGEVAQFVAQATGSDPDDARVDELLAQTEGNPLFLRELLQLHGTQAPAEGIREVVRARLSLLSRESRALLEAAAVLGREFAAAPLSSVAAVSEVEARALVEPAAHAGIVEPLGDPPRWRFTHVLLRQGLYEDLPVERRAALHRAAFGALNASPAELAHHAFHGMPAVSREDATRATMRAADHALELLAFEDARDFYARAESLDGGFEATLGIGVASMRLAEIERGREACRRAAELARRLGDGERFARAVLAAGYERMPYTREPDVIAQLEEALTLLPPGDGALRARCLAQLATERQPEADTAPLFAMARDAVAMARRLGDPETLRFTLTTASLAISVFIDPDERIALNGEVLRLALAAGDKRVALRAHMLLVGDFWDRGDPDGAEPHLRAFETLAREFRHGRFEWWSLLLRGTAALCRGRFDEAARRFAEIEPMLKEARGAALVAMPLSVACVRERYDEAASIEANVRATLGAFEWDLGSCFGEMLIAQLHGRAGDRVRATGQLAAVKAHPRFAAIAEPGWLVPVIDACHLAGDVELAARLHRALLPRAARFVYLGPLTACVDLPYARHLGILAETLGRLDEAVSFLEDAEARIVRAGMNGHLARVRYELARVLIARGDRSRAAELAAQSRALATELGQLALLPRLDALATETPLSLRREADVWCVAWGDRVVRLRDSRGLALLARLVENAGQELHVLQLVSPGDEPRDEGDAGPALDDAAVQSYRRRLLELREELDEAERFADVARAERARTEADFLTQELARAVGLGGRERRVGNPAERARTAVQKRLRDAIRRIEEQLPDLGRHLDQSIRTGVFCAYVPRR